MTIDKFTDARIWIDSKDLSSDTNQVEVTAAVADLDVTNFDSNGWMERIGGLRTSTYNVTGFLDTDAGKSENFTWGAIMSGAGHVVSIAVSGGEGQTAVFGRGLTTNVSIFGQVGDVAPYAGTIMGSHPASMVEGVVAFEKQTVTTSGTTSGTAQQLGALTGNGYATFHVTAVSGLTSLIVQSDSTASFASPTNHALVATSSTGGKWVSLTSTSADTYWRLAAAIASGTTITVAGCIGLNQ